MKKRILGLILALCMLSAFVPLIAVAETGTQYGDYLYYQVNEDNTAVTITDCDMSATEIVIPSEINGLPVIGIDYAFYNCSSLESIEIPNSVTSIGSLAFYYCRSLESVTIGNSVTSIGEKAFYSCSSLESIVIPDSVTIIGNSAFANCRSLESIEIPDSVTNIGYYSFGYCSSLVSIDVSSNNSTYSSADGVLFNKDKTELICCPGGKSGSYTIPDSVTSICDYAFEYCTSLESIEIPDSVTSIGYCAFYVCRSLTSITIGSGVTSIGDWAFRDCSSLESIEIPNSVTMIAVVKEGIGNNIKSIFLRQQQTML